eukprot:g7603.t1
MLNGKSFLLVGSTLGKLAFWELPKSFSSKNTPIISRSFTTRAHSSMITGMVQRLKKRLNSKSYHLAVIDLSGQYILWNAIDMVKLNVIEKDDVAQSISYIPHSDLVILGYSSGVMSLVNCEKNGFVLMSIYAGVNDDDQKKSQSPVKAKQNSNGGTMGIGVASLHSTPTSLFAGIDQGYVRYWDISQLPKNAKDGGDWDTSFQSRSVWRAHQNPVENIVYIAKKNVLLLGCTLEKAASLWTTNGICIGKFGSDYVWKVSDASTYLDGNILDDKSLIPKCGEKAREERRLAKSKQRKKRIRLDRAERKKKYLDISMDLDEDAARENYDEESEDDNADDAVVEKARNGSESYIIENGRKQYLEKKEMNMYQMNQIRKKFKDKSLDWCMSLYNNHRKIPSIGTVPGRELIKNLKGRKAKRSKEAREYERKRFLTE